MQCRRMADQTHLAHYDKVTCLYVTSTFQNTLPWKEACHLASFFYYFSLSTAVVSLSAAWSVRCNQSMPIFPLRLNERSAIRVSQSSHMVWILKKKLGDSTEDISTANAVSLYFFALRQIL